MNAPARVALIGAAGHGLWHRRTIHRLASAGRVRLVGLCDLNPIEPAEDAPIEGVPRFADHRELLASVAADVVVICTPPHTHLPIALDALAAGADLLLEKPPLASMAEHRQLAAALDAHGRICQVGFQALGSVALTELVAALCLGKIGEVSAIGAVGAWWRPNAYWARAPWAGRRAVDGRGVVDGALVNPFAHAIMQSLAVAEYLTGVPARPVLVEIERYRTTGIDVDDTACLRVRTSTGLRLLVAVSLRSATFLAGEVHAFGDAGDAALEYPTDRVRLPGERDWREVSGRIGLLENLLDHREDPVVALLAPLARTAPFTALVEAIMAAPPPALVPPEYLAPHPSGDGQVISGIDAVLRDAVQRGALLSELSVPWATEPYRVAMDGRGVSECGS